VSPRPYQAGERRLAARHATRSKIIAAARELLADRATTSFSIDAVAQRADVARMTVYYQFKSKGKLLEAVFDDFGARANMSNMRKVFREGDPVKALQTLVEVFCHLWKSQGDLVRRLNGLAALDPEVAEALAERGSWRKEAIVRIVERLSLTKSRDDLADIVFALTSYETYDALISQKKGQKHVVRLIQRAVSSLATAL